MRRKVEEIIRNFQQEIDSLRESISQKDQEILSLKKEKEDLEKEILSLKRERESLTKRVGYLEGRLEGRNHNSFPLKAVWKAIIIVIILSFASWFLYQETKEKNYVGGPVKTQVQVPQQEKRIKFLNSLEELRNFPVSSCSYSYVGKRDQVISAAKTCYIAGQCDKSDLKLAQEWLEYLNSIHSCTGIWNKTLINS